MSGTERYIFLAAIRAAPGELTPRLVYADWLDERGNPDGELVRLLCEVQASDYAGGSAWERMEFLTSGLDEEIGRLNERDQCLLACDCAERVLPVFEKALPNRDEPRCAVRAAKRFVFGEATLEELSAAETAVQEIAKFLPINAAIGGDGRSFGEAFRVVHAAYAAKSAAWIVARGRDGPRSLEAIASWIAEHAQTAAFNFAERRWQLCRALEYRLGFVPLPAIQRSARNPTDVEQPCPSR